MVRTIITVMDARHHRATHAAPPTPISASHRVKWQPVLHARELVCNTTDWDQRVCTARTKLSNGPATTAHPQHKTCAFGFARAPEGTTAGRTVAPTPQRSPTLNKANQCSRSAAPSIGRPPRKASTNTADKTAAGAAFRAMRCKRQTNANEASANVNALAPTSPPKNRKYSRSSCEFPPYDEH